MIVASLHPLVAALWPESVIALGAAAVLLLGLVARHGGSRWTVWPAVLVLVLAASATPSPHAGGGVPAFFGFQSLQQDSLLQFARWAACLVGVLILLANRHVPNDAHASEFFSLVLFSIAGIGLVAAANDLVLLFLALELVSVPTYILIGLSRRGLRCQEAAGKYFFLGAFAAALMLYGFSFLYGAAGTTQMMPCDTESSSIARALDLTSVASHKLTLLGLVLALAGLAFKIAAVPLHFYVADVYQGAASPVSGLLGFVPKFAGFIALVRILSMCGWAHGRAMFWLLWALALATMVVGNTLALMQQNVKRVLAYSSIAHSGYLLVGLVAAGQGDPAAYPRDALAAVLFYLPVYGVMNLGAFAALACFRRQRGAPQGSDEEDDDSAESFTDLVGVARRHPWAALALAVCVVGLMGLPPTGGFTGKLYLFSAALASGADPERHGALVLLVVLGVVNAAIGAVYYLRIVATCYTHEHPHRLPEPPDVRSPAARCPALRLALAVCALAVLAIFWRPAGLYRYSRTAAGGLGPAPRTVLASPAAQPSRP